MPERLAAALSLLLASGVTTAASPYAGSGLDLGVSVQREVTDVTFDSGASGELRYTRVGVDLWQTGIPWFQPGLTAGVGWATTEGPGSAPSRSLDGESLGLRLRSDLPLFAAIGLRADAAWVYHAVSATDDTDTGSVETRWRWYDTDVRLGLTGDFDGLRLEGGGTWRNIDGERELDDSVTDRFDGAEETGVYARVAVAMDGGEVAIEGETGARDRIGIHFSRRF